MQKQCPLFQHEAGKIANDQCRGGRRELFTPRGIRQHVKVLVIFSLEISSEKYPSQERVSFVCIRVHSWQCLWNALKQWIFRVLGFSGRQKVGPVGAKDEPREALPRWGGRPRVLFLTI